MDQAVRSGKFKQWWQRMNRADRSKRDQNFHRWLSYACRTVALRGDHNQQRVVYTIFKRYHESRYRKISRANAQRVFRIINRKTDNLPPRNPAPEKVERSPVQIVRKRTVKTITGAGGGRQKD